MIFEELSVSFENPATDAMGYDAVEGKLICAEEAVQIHFKQKDRAFRKNPTATIEFAYDEVEKLTLVSRWFRPPEIVFETFVADRLSGFPGAGVGRVDLQIIDASKKEVRKLIELFRFRQSEQRLLRSDDRLRGERGGA